MLMKTGRSKFPFLEVAARLRHVGSLGLTTAMLMFVLACHPGPIVNRSEQRVGGTIAGVVTATKGTVALTGRKVTAVDVVSGTRYDATTNITGGYTIKVPEGTYRLELETREGETLKKRPHETRVKNGDLDSGRDFDVTASIGRS
jgi:hypothetical protein